MLFSCYTWRRHWFYTVLQRSLLYVYFGLERDLCSGDKCLECRPGRRTDCPDRGLTPYSSVLLGKCRERISKLGHIVLNSLLTIHFTVLCSRARVTELIIFSQCWEMSCHLILWRYICSTDLHIRWPDFFRRNLFLFTCCYIFPLGVTTTGRSESRNFTMGRICSSDVGKQNNKEYFVG
jgi:hypothetical protein